MSFKFVAFGLRFQNMFFFKKRKIKEQLVHLVKTLEHVEDSASGPVIALGLDLCLDSLLIPALMDTNTWLCSTFRIRPPNAAHMQASGLLCCSTNTSSIWKKLSVKKKKDFF